MSTIKVDTLQNSVGENLVFGNKNLLINGGMNIFQRSTSVTGVTTGGYLAVDRFRHNFAGGIGTWTVSRSTDVPSGQGFGYSLKMDCTTADASPAAGDKLQIQQRIEGQNLQHLLKGTSSAKKVTLSFWVKTNKTGTYIIELSDFDNTRSISQAYTVSSSNTWEKKELTFDGDTSGTFDNDNNHSLNVLWHLGAGSDITSGTLQTSWGSEVAANRAVGQVNLADSTSNEWYMTGCQLEVGSKATDFEFEDYQTTINKCYRYCEKIDVRLINLSRPTGAGNGGAYINLYFKQQKRTTPTSTITTGLINFNRPDFIRITNNVSTSDGGIVQFSGDTDEHTISDAEL
tara:strand:+ start:822 stop:1853 length:1032 start_codon:yes stop_codon:yes gene_type:complete